MSLRITIIQGHPDRQVRHFGHALAEAYAEGAGAAGHEVRHLHVAELAFPLVSSQRDWEHGEAPEAVAAAQRTIAWADRLIIFFPLWMGTMPAMLKGFLEQVLRPGFGPTAKPGAWPQPLRGKRVRLVVTMGMPAFVYRWYFRAHGLKNLERNILAFTGARPVRTTLIGRVEAGGPRRHAKWLDRMRTLGRQGR